MLIASLTDLAQAKVVAVGESHFVVEHEVIVPLDAQASCRLLEKPSQWWNSEHTWSVGAKT